MKPKTVMTTVAAMLLLLTACGTQPKTQETAPPAQDATASEKNWIDGEQMELVKGKHNVEIEVQDYGTIALELDADAAPVTVTNFLNLTKEGFYDGLTFHRIVSSFVIQGGDPEGNGSGNSDQKIYGEFAQNGWENPLTHTRGTISMARTNDPNSASSQFFIVHEESEKNHSLLDGKYAAFGKVTSGIEVVDKICEAMEAAGLQETIPAENQPIITAVRVVE